MKRSSTDYVLGGVCGGIGEELGIEPWLIRILWLLVGTCTLGIWIYLACWFLMEEE